MCPYCRTKLPNSCIPYLNQNNIYDNSDNIEIKKVKIDDYTYDVPGYLISKITPKKITNNLIKKSLYFTRNIILNKFNLEFNERFNIILRKHIFNSFEKRFF